MSKGFILTVDDSEMMRDIISNAVKSLGYESLEAENGKEALEVLEANKENVKLIVLDWIMPIMDGYETLKRVKESEEYKNIPVIMVTTENDQLRIISAVKLGADNYIVKPFNITDLITRLKQSLKEN